MEAFIFRLNCSDGGVPKTPVAQAQLSATGLAGDRQAQTSIHGGPDRALCLYSMERIDELQSEGHPITPGSTGENVTVKGLDWSMLEPGQRLSLGNEVVIEISGYATPCSTIADSFTNRAFERVAQKRHPGSSRLYARVIKNGRLEVGQVARMLAPEE